MLRLTREVRFAVNTDDPPRGDAAPPRADNSFAGSPSLNGLGYFFTLRATVVGPQDPASNYLLNIKSIDQAVRATAVPLVTQAVRAGRFGGGATLLRDLFDALRNAWPPVSLECLSLGLSPFLSLEAHSTELPMVRLSLKFEFSASHRLHNPALSDQANRDTFGKCNNPHGHGHNYELQVTVRARPDAQGLVLPLPQLECVVARTVIDRFDHKNLNVDVADFHELIPSVENIATVIYRLLKEPVAQTGASLAAVTVWETPKTWAEYSE